MNNKIGSLATGTNVPRFLSMTLNGASLMVNVSLLITVDEDMFKPVTDVLEGRCFRTLVNDELEDETMWRGVSRFMLLEITDSCPPVPHSCGQYVRDIEKDLRMERHG